MCWINKKLKETRCSWFGHQVFLIEHFCWLVSTNFCCFFLFKKGKRKEKQHLGPSVPQQVLIRAQRVAPGNRPSQIDSAQPGPMLHAGLTQTIMPWLQLICHCAILLGVKKKEPQFSPFSDLYLQLVNVCFLLIKRCTRQPWRAVKRERWRTMCQRTPARLFSPFPFVTAPPLSNPIWTIPSGGRWINTCK